MARVLVAEDHAAVAQLIVESLGRAGHAVTLIHTAAEILPAVDRWRADVLVCDCWLADGSCVPLLQSADRVLCPVVLITGELPEASLAKTCPAIRAVLRKPFAVDDLLRCVDQASGGAEHVRQAH